MPKSVFFSFKEKDREAVLLIKGMAVNSNYSNLNFKVHDYNAPKIYYSRI